MNTSSTRSSTATTVQDTQVADAWHALLDDVAQEQVALLRELAHSAPPSLAEHFYAGMLDDPRASRFLSSEQVQSRLKPSMLRWITNLLTSGPDDVDAQIAEQRLIGDVHARIGIPVDLVIRGTRMLKHQLYRHIINVAPPELASATIALVSDLFDLALEMMSHAYSVARERSTRLDASYRMFSLIQNIGTERERQRALLLDWENALLYRYASAPVDVGTAPQLAQSEFGLWFSHKGLPSFGDTAETRQVSALIASIDDLVSSPGENPSTSLPSIRAQLAQTRALIGMLFDNIGALEAGRDALTSLLNRRFLPTVLRREVALASESSGGFSVLLLDLDHFKAINDAHGHDGGDRALQHVAANLAQHTRSSDYLFRFGGEEFVMVLGSVSADQAVAIADELRERIAASPVTMSDGSKVPVTASIGVAVHDGHPDYERVLARADAAMYQAKRNGRNRVELATAAMVEPPGSRLLSAR
ncbi:diguanylate cyclase [Lysobacter ciconiae]|uniref:Diguanylate cyclase DosC n=1 Tax=Novilysobacter ciconiae TaxID=2781022 RepID=A0A7S6UEK2_9GAMM|nr:diguanylate cyclase [Lysobacter ciconiae]QOW18816.1 diguanylate cyclase [Lysobacter ciconiae]